MYRLLTEILEQEVELEYYQELIKKISNYDSLPGTEDARTKFRTTETSSNSQDSE